MSELQSPAEDAGPLRRCRHWEGRVGAGGAARADSYIAGIQGLPSRSQLKARSASLKVEGRIIKPSRPLREGELLSVDWIEEGSLGIVPQELPLDVIYEDSRVIVINKAQGMVTHPGAGNRQGTLANALMGRLLRAGAATDAATDAAKEAAAFRAGIVHRLDKDTSGLIIAAKDLEAQAFLAEQFKDRLVRKEYLALLRGEPASRRGRVSDCLARDKRDRKRFAPTACGGRQAVSDYRLLALWRLPARGSLAPSVYSLVAFRPKTGRTHQLRVHALELGTHILGDPLYGKKDPRFPAATLMLHARRLGILLPGGSVPELFRAALPERFRLIIRELGKPALVYPK